MIYFQLKHFCSKSTERNPTILSLNNTLPNLTYSLLFIKTWLTLFFPDLRNSSRKENVQEKTVIRHQKIIQFSGSVKENQAETHLLDLVFSLKA